MPNFDVNVRIGASAVSHPIAQLPLTRRGIGTICQAAGSYHIAAMGTQFFQYVLQPRTALLPPTTGFAPPPAYMRLPSKVKAPSISGNIGEAVAAEWAANYLNLLPHQIVHIKPSPGSGRPRAPDYLMEIGTTLSTLLPAGVMTQWPLNVHAALAAAPQLWPVESKCRESGSTQGFEQALQQLAAFWHQTQAFASGIGYGLVVNFTSLNPQQLTISIILPRNAVALQNRLATTTYAAYMNAFAADAVTTGALHGF